MASACAVDVMASDKEFVRGTKTLQCLLGALGTTPCDCAPVPVHVPTVIATGTTKRVDKWNRGETIRWQPVKSVATACSFAGHGTCLKIVLCESIVGGHSAALSHAGIVVVKGECVETCTYVFDPLASAKPVALMCATLLRKRSASARTASRRNVWMVTGTCLLYTSPSPRD